MNAAMLLQHAARVIEDRQRTYGSPERSFADAAARWLLVLGIDISPAHLASIVDVAGYAALLREVTR